MGYLKTICVVAIFVLSWLAMFDSRELKSKQIRMLKKVVAKWESAPKVEKICEGKVWRKSNITTFQFKYDSPVGAFCDAEYQIKIDKKNGKSVRHKFDCTMVPEKDPEEPDFD